MSNFPIFPCVHASSTSFASYQFVRMHLRSHPINSSNSFANQNQLFPSFRKFLQTVQMSYKHFSSFHQCDSISFPLKSTYKNTPTLTHTFCHTYKYIAEDSHTFSFCSTLCLSRVNVILYISPYTLNLLYCAVVAMLLLKYTLTSTINIS